MRLGAALLLLALFATVGSGTACAGGAVGPAPTPSATAAPSPADRPTVRIVPADNGGTVAARVGDLVQVSLGEQYTWVIDAPDGVVLVAEVRGALFVRGTQAVFRAASPGRASVTATGTPACPAGAACPQFAVLFRTTVAVGP